MSYKCKKCGEPQPHGSKQRLYVVYRKGQFGKEIEAEHPVCAGCYIKLTGTLHPMDKKMMENPCVAVLSSEGEDLCVENNPSGKPRRKRAKTKKQRKQSEE